MKSTVIAPTLFTLAGLPQPETEYPFARAIKRRWRLDYAWPALMLALEIEGGVWNGGRHVRGAGFEADIEKYNAAGLLGWRLLRATPEMARDGRLLDVLQAAARAWLPGGQEC